MNKGIVSDKVASAVFQEQSHQQGKCRSTILPPSPPPPAGKQAQLLFPFFNDSNHSVTYLFTYFL